LNITALSHGAGHGSFPTFISEKNEIKQNICDAATHTKTHDVPDEQHINVVQKHNTIQLSHTNMFSLHPQLKMTDFEFR